jgi:hypothetical protein
MGPVVCRKAQVVQSLCPYIHGVSSLVETLGHLDIGQSYWPESIPKGEFLYDTYNTFCTIHIRNIGRYEWASVVCRKAQVVQSVPHHAEYGRSGAEREFLRSV